MRKVTRKSISEGRITLTIPGEYREIATIICKRSSDSKIPVSILIWEMIKAHLGEEKGGGEGVSFDSLAGSLRKYAPLYVPLGVARERARKEALKDVARKNLSA